LRAARRRGAKIRERLRCSIRSGFALEDYSALRFLHSLLKEERAGARQIDLVPELDNPKDLYGGTLGRGRPHRVSASRREYRHEQPCFLLLALRAISVPVHAELRWGRRPCAFADIRSMLESQGLNVCDRGDLRGPANPVRGPVDGYRHLGEVTEWNRTVHDAVYGELAESRMPILLGGDHSLSIGSISATARYCRERGRKLRVLWLDAHADFNTNVLTPSGNIHGMPVACLCGYGPKDLIEMSGQVPAIQAANIRQVGIRKCRSRRKALRS